MHGLQTIVFAIKIWIANLALHKVVVGVKGHHRDVYPWLLLYRAISTSAQV